MKIGFDAKRAFNNHSGLGVYSRNFIDFIEANHSELNITLFSPKVNRKLYNSSFSTRTSKWGALWRSFLIYFDIKKSRLDVYHGLAGELPCFIPREVKTVVTVHDLLFERFPNDYPWIDRIIYRWKAKFACKKADKIIAVSESTKRDLIHFYHIDSSKIIVCPVGINIERKINLPRLHRIDYMVCISSFLARKNQTLLIESFNLIADKIPLDLILIGSGSNWHEVKKIADKSPYSARISFIPKANDEEKFAYLSHAKFSVYPSKYEGFGIPIIESFIYGVPIVVSDNSTHKEVADNSAIFFKNEDVNDLADKLVHTYKMNDMLKADLIQKGLEMARKYEPKVVSRHLIDLYQEL